MNQTPQELADSIKSSWWNFIDREESREPFKRKNLYASGFSPCTRRLTLDMTHGDKIEPFPPEVLARFRRGNDRERDLMADLGKVGPGRQPAVQRDRTAGTVGAEGPQGPHCHHSEGRRTPGFREPPAAPH